MHEVLSCPTIPTIYSIWIVRLLDKRGKWIARLLEYDIEIKPIKLVKGQGLYKLLANSNVRHLVLIYF